MRAPIFVLFSLVLTFGSCINDQDLSALDQGPVPVGTWSEINYEENGFILEKGQKLKENTYGFQFLSNGKLVCRANSGFCGTPPIATSDFEGTWTKDGDIIRLKSAFWGGIQIEEWNIISHSGNTLRIEVISSELEMSP